MPVLNIRGLAIGEGPPKICIPLVGSDCKGLANNAKKSVNLGADLYEMRADFTGNTATVCEIIETLKGIRKLIKNSPLIFTIRSKEEGGAGDLPLDRYVEINKAVVESGLADIIDVELNKGPHTIKAISRILEGGKGYMLLSRHFFQGTPSKDEILSTYIRMQAFPSDITKIAVMATHEKDLLRLFEAAIDMRDKIANRPYIAIAMGEKGILSRIGGGVFGSALTFAKGTEASAPGQLDAIEVRSLLDIIHRKEI